jgi:hypothetical protein
MNARWRVWSPWLGWMAVCGCLNPQPDTIPLSSGPVTPSAVTDGSDEPAAVTPGSSTGGVSPPADEGHAPPAQRPAELASDAGVAPPDAGGGIPSNPAVSTFSATDAGLLDPDAGVPPGSAGD